MSTDVPQPPGPTESQFPGFESVDYRTENAFHGTRLASAERIWAEKRFNPPQDNEDDYRFGPGCYFWENSRQAAVRWSQLRHSDGACGIIRASLRFLSMLDLLIREHREVLEEVRQRMAQVRNLQPKEVRHTAVANLMRKANLIDGLRAQVVTGKNPNFDPDSRLIMNMEVLLCAYEPMNIVVTALEPQPQ